MSYGNRFIPALVFASLLLSACGSPQVDSTGPSPVGASDSPSPQASAESLDLYPECDTELQQLLEKPKDGRGYVFAYDCASDRELATPALDFDPPVNNLEACQLNETSPGRLQYNDNTVGFPRTSNPSRLSDGVHKIAVIPVQWPDLAGDDKIFSIAAEAKTKVTDWYRTYSRGNVLFDWQIYDEWITLPNSSEEYSQSIAQQNTNQWGEANTRVISKFWADALEASDPFVDFTGVEIVFFLLPTNQDVAAEFNLWPPGGGVFQTDEGPIDRGLTPGSYHFRNGNKVWMFWIHEMLHYFKMPDLYWTDQNSVKRTANTMPGPIQDYDIMSNQGGVTKSLNGWLMWMAGWAADAELYCLTPETFKNTSFEIFDVGVNDDSLKSVILTLSDTTAVVVESRRKSQFDIQSPRRSREGVIVYHLDTNFGHGEGPMTLLAPAGRTLIDGLSGNLVDPTLDATLYEGNSIEIAGYRIEVNEARSTSDVISITKIEDWVPGSEPTYVCHTRENRDLLSSPKITCPIKY